MIEITDVQAKILEVFINHQNSFDRSSNNVGPKKRGLSSVGISKKGINKRTFRNNCSFLLDHYLIKIIHEEEHPYSSNKKDNHIIWKYYELTPFGELVYLKWSMEELQKKNPELDENDRERKIDEIEWQLRVEKKKELVLNRAIPKRSIDHLKREIDAVGKSLEKAADVLKLSESFLKLLPDRILAIRKIAPEITDKRFIGVIKNALENIDFFPEQIIFDPISKETITASSDIVVRYTIPFKNHQELTLQESYTLTDQEPIVNWEITDIDPKSKEEVVVETKVEEDKSRLPDDIIDLVEFMMYWDFIFAWLVSRNKDGPSKIAQDRLSHDLIEASKKLRPRQIMVGFDVMEKEGVTMGKLVNLAMDLEKVQNKTSKKLLKNIQKDPRLSKLFKKYMKQINVTHSPHLKEILSKLR
jgi:hypothetical protein